jgi:hypothetical protein
VVPDDALRLRGTRLQWSQSLARDSVTGGASSNPLPSRPINSFRSRLAVSGTRRLFHPRSPESTVNSLQFAGSRPDRRSPHPDDDTRRAGRRHQGQELPQRTAVTAVRTGQPIRRSQHAFGDRDGRVTAWAGERARGELGRADRAAQLLVARDSARLGAAVAPGATQLHTASVWLRRREPVRRDPSAASRKFGGSFAASGRAWSHPLGAGISIPACLACGPSHAFPTHDTRRASTARRRSR